MKKLIINNEEGDKSVTLHINDEAEKALYDLIRDFDRETRVTGKLFRLSITMQNLLLYSIVNAELGQECPLAIPADYAESLYVLLDIFDFFNHLKFSA